MKMNHGGVAIWTILVLNRSAAHFRLRKLNLSTPPPPPPHAKNIRSPLGLSGLSHGMPVRVCHLLARPCRLNVDIPWICRYFLFAGYLTSYEWMICTWLFNLKNTWTSQSWMQNILQFYCQTVGVWVSQFSWFCQEINPGTTVYSALPTFQHPSISELLNYSPRLLPPRPTCIQKGKYQRSCLSLLSPMNLFSKAVYSIVMTLSSTWRITPSVQCPGKKLNLP